MSTVWATRPPAIRTRLSAMMFVQYFIYGSWLVTMGTFMGQGLRFDGTQIGLVYGTPALAAILSPFLVGMIADRFFATERVLAVLHLAGAALLFLASRQTEFWPFYAAMLAYSLTYMPTLALVNAIAFRQIDDPAAAPFIEAYTRALWSGGGREDGAPHPPCPLDVDDPQQVPVGNGLQRGRERLNAYGIAPPSEAATVHYCPAIHWYSMMKLPKRPRRTCSAAGSPASRGSVFHQVSPICSALSMEQMSRRTWMVSSSTFASLTRTSSPTRLNESAVCVALPNGSRIDATSSVIEAGSLNALKAGITTATRKCRYIDALVSLRTRALQARGAPAQLGHPVRDAVNPPDLVRRLSSALGLRAQAIGVAGLKDARAVTVQMVSLQGAGADLVSAFTMTNIGEAQGIALAAKAANMPAENIERAARGVHHGEAGGVGGQPGDRRPLGPGRAPAGANSGGRVSAWPLTSRVSARA